MKSKAAVLFITTLSLSVILASGCKTSKQAMVETQVAATVSALSETMTAEASLPSPTPTPVITNTLFGEWQLSAMLENGNPIDETPDYEIVFKSNGAYDALIDYSPESGSWELSSDGFFILLDEGEPRQKTWQIIEMTTQLHVKTSQGGKAIEFIFEPLFAD
jgi:hypothetical protein